MKQLRSKETLAKIERYNELTVKLDQLKKEREAIRKELLALRDSKGADNFKAGPWLISFKNIVRNIFNKAEYLEVNGKNSLDQYMSESEAITIKVKHV